MKQNKPSFLSWLRFVILCLVSATLAYPFLVLVFLPILVYQNIISVIVRLTDSKCRYMITGLSAAITGPDPYAKPLMKVYPYILFSGEITREKVIHSINERIIRENLYPELQYTAIRKLGYYFWQQVENFSVEHHVRYLNPDHPNQPVLRSELRTSIRKQIAQQPFDKRYSPWEIIVVPNVFDPDNSTIKSAIFLHATHILMDGLSLVKFLQRFSPESWGWALAKTMSDQKSNHSFMKKIKKSLELLLTGPYHALQFVFFAGDKSEFLETVFQTEHKGDWGLSDQDPPKIPAQQLKLIRKNHGVGISSIMTTITTVGIARFIQRKCETGFAKTPGQFNLHMVLPLPGHPDDKLTNHWTMVRLPIKMEDTKDPVALAKNIHAKYQELAHSVVPLVNFLVCRFLGTLPICMHPDVTEADMRQTLAVTNFPGPKKTQIVFGTPAETWNLLASGTTGTGFACVIGSLCDEFWIDGAALPTIFTEDDDPEILESCFKSVLIELGKH